MGKLLGLLAGMGLALAVMVPQSPASAQETVTLNTKSH